jgi:ER lumen protein retaining receptor
LQSQELTATFLAVRLLCSFMMEYDVHTFLDLLTLGATGWVIYMLRVPLKSSYQSELDVMGKLMVIVPCLGLAILAHPTTRHSIFFRVLWAFCVYLEAVSVLPQLRMMQRAKVVEKFTAHYVFALGASRFISCAHWVLQIMEGDKYLWRALGSGVWPIMVLVSEVVQTFVLADFCYYYVKSFAEGTGVIQLPAGVV